MTTVAEKSWFEESRVLFGGGKGVGFTAIFTGRNEVVAKVIFLHLFVILFTGGVSSRENPPAGRTPPPGLDTPQTRPPWDQTPQEQTPPWDQTLPRADTPPPGSRLQHTVNERPVCILLECILVVYRMEFDTTRCSCSRNSGQISAWGTFCLSKTTVCAAISSQISFQFTGEVV